MGLVNMFDLQNDIEKGIRKYPSLQFEMQKGLPIVKGTFIAHDKKSKTEIESYEVLIGFPQKYPYVFPLVIETSKKIPRELDRHVKSDGTLCLGNWQDELSVCKNGITFTYFLDEVLNTHLCREYVKEKTNKYPTGERSHGMEGIWEGYYEILQTTDKEKVLTELGLILNHKSIGRNAPCYCNSGKKYKACHEKVEPDILKVGRNIVIGIMGALKSDYEKQK
ncbi:MAG: SEC-C domain-containing protein [Bacteroidia bacterium]|nr:SEC-C domain-containing protein [Bacteroidia bacterium]